MVRLAPALASIATLFASACGAKDARPSGEAPPPPHETLPPPVARPAADAAILSVDPMAMCGDTLRFFRHAVDCAAGDIRATLTSNLKNLEMIAGRITSDTPPGGRESAGAMCAFGAYSFDRMLATRSDLTCAAALTDAERVRVRGYLQTFYARRTLPRPTGDRVLDDQLSALAAARDAMCACTESTCAGRTQKLVDAAVKPVPRDKQTAMADAEAIVDEVSRCSERVEAGIPLELP